MSERNDTHIDRIKEELLFVNRTLKDTDKDTFLKDEIIQHAIAMSLITIGECANHLSDGFKKKHPQINWIEIIAVRNIAAHRNIAAKHGTNMASNRRKYSTVKRFFQRIVNRRLYFKISKKFLASH